MRREGNEMKPYGLQSDASAAEVAGYVMLAE